MSLSIEAADHGIDVLAVHPSYTATSLYDKTEKLAILKLFAKFSMTPADVADAIVNSVGRGAHPMSTYSDEAVL
jgi:short-subunit dehydrogenase